MSLGRGGTPRPELRGGSFVSTADIYPWYIVCDESVSMSGDPIAAVNDALPELHAEIASNPVISHKTRLSIIAFSDGATVELPLSNLADIESVPVLEVRGGTSYAAAFKLLRTQIESDMQMLKAAGSRVARPAVFFFTDGEPTDGPGEWERAHAALIDPTFKWRPNIVSFAAGAGANEDTLKSVATKAALIAPPGVSPAKALAEFVGLLTKSMIASVGAPPVYPPAGSAATDHDLVDGVFPTNGSAFIDLGANNQISH